MGERRRGRECALQMLFCLDLGGGQPAEVAQGFWTQQEGASSPEVAAFAERLTRGVAAERAEIDRQIAAAIEHWRIERLAVVDRNVLRIAVWELQHELGTPPAVIIDEAIEIARTFGGEGSAAFVNGVLDAIHRRLAEGATPPPDQVAS